MYMSYCDRMSCSFKVLALFACSIVASMLQCYFLWVGVIVNSSVMSLLSLNPGRVVNAYKGAAQALVSSPAVFNHTEDFGQ